MKINISTLLHYNSLQSLSTIVTSRWHNGSVIILLGSEDVLSVRVNVSLPSNMLSLLMLRSNEALVCPAGITTAYGPEA